MQKMENAAVEGIEYQRGTLFDYEVKEYKARQIYININGNKK